MNVRPLPPSEFARWLPLRKALWPDCSDDMHDVEVERYLADDAAVLLAEADGAAIGFAEVTERERVEGSLEPRVAYLEGWYVVPERRGTGVGRALLAAVESWARSRGLRELASDSDLGNQGSIAAHAALGFRETFRIVQFLKRVPPDDRARPGENGG
ncbi:MAG: GNAT family N-acetyltransferase [Planctomycetes bacterium]|nr:GNAT family N-acetyltransferase [Planctomycetota bacterium]